MKEKRKISNSYRLYEPYVIPNYEEHPAKNKSYESKKNYLMDVIFAENNDVELRPMDESLSHWICSNGDDITIVKKDIITKHRSGYQYKTVSHVTPTTVIRKKFIKALGEHGIGLPDIRNISQDRIRDKQKEMQIINPVIRNGIKLNRARVIANYFVPNPDRLPFIGCRDGNIYHLRAQNLYWTDKNIYPELNFNEYHEEISHDVVIHSTGLRVMVESMSEHNWEKSYVKLAVPIPKDLIVFFKSMGIAIQSAVYSSLRFLSQWSFCVYAIECSERQQVWVGYTNALEGSFTDIVSHVAAKIPWLQDMIFSEGRGSVRLRYLTLSMTRREALESAGRFMNEYHGKNWQIINDDFYDERFEREIILRLSREHLELLDASTMKKHGVNLDAYLHQYVAGQLNRILSTGKKPSPDQDQE